MSTQVTKQEVFEIVDKANQEVLSAINEFSGKTDQRFEKIEDEIVNIKSTLNTQVVTKDYLDQKTAEIRGDFTATLRKEDNKVGVLTNKLGDRKVLPTTDIQEVLAMEPFPQIP